MLGNMVIIRPDNTMTVRTYNGQVPLADLREAVGDGPIESIPHWDTWGTDKAPCWAICNEDGKDPHNPLPVNELANMLWFEVAPQMQGLDTLCGPVAVLWGDKAFMRAL